ncbi:hypothetical protein [Cryobacterium sp. TMT3-29-2]|uniref:hypothetical protein n=1 Tax=Cryobacterium sp. TMT3-29-2 TaxID=2555867 RepID=UPI0010741EFF|nr:hypothetical protein [Cryobacterium sp. TMT3-29-2]TFC84491.1 hypothetical protein E3O67_12860 [Cryobacterium sp. TMT3-29-2]
MAAKRQCKGTVGGAKNPNKGKPCRNWAISGSEFCGVHGGSIKIATATAADLQNRCKAHSSRTGEQCKKAAIRGGTVCKTHGGSSGHVANKARQRLLELAEPAVVQLNRILDAPGTSDSDRLRAIQMVLDRTGSGPGVNVEVEVKPWEVTMQHVFAQSTGMQINRAVPEALLAQMGELPAYATTDATFLNVEDADVIEDENDIPRIIPGKLLGEKAHVRGSAEPPQRK